MELPKLLLKLVTKCLQLNSTRNSVIKPEAFFASDTSSFPITAKSKNSWSALLQPVLGMMLVEVICSEHTDPAVFERMTQFDKDRVE